MTARLTRRIVLARRPTGEPRPTDFTLREDPVPELREGEVLVRTIYLSLDPYMRGRMRDARSYAPAVELGAVMVGEIVGQVLESRDPGREPGDFVTAQGGWQTLAVVPGATTRKLDPQEAPLSTALGVLGMPGMTAYWALLDICRPRAGETVVVSAASGAVGALAGQIAKIKAARVVGVAGSPEKCAYVVGELGFDACIDRRSENVPEAFGRHAPEGIDAYFDNTAGPILEAVLQCINLHARIALVGLIAQYNATAPTAGPDLAPLLVRRASITGFLVVDYGARFREFHQEMSQWLRAGQIRYREDRVIGLDSAVGAFIGLLRGENFGKAIVCVGDDPTA